MVDRLKAATGAKAVALLQRGPDGFTPIDRTLRFDLDDVRPLLMDIPSARRLWFGHVAAAEGFSVFCMPVDVVEDKIVLLAFVDMPPELIAMGPIAMLQIAQDWGDSFKVVRDSIIVRKALTEYAEAHAAGPWSGDLPKPVSVNVSVRSLLDDNYVAAVEDAVARSGLNAA